MVEAEYDGQMEMDPNEEEEYILQQRQMQMQNPNEIYQDEYGNEVMMNPVGQIPMQYENNDPTNALVSLSTP